MAMDAATRTEWLERYRSGAALLRRAWEEAPPEARTWRPAPEAWSALEVVAHCADSETYAAVRIRLLLSEPEPLIVGYDENAWARDFDYQHADPEACLDLVERLRAHTSAVLDRVPEARWGRVGRHTQSGAYGTDQWLESYGQHLEVHARQIQRTLGAWRTRTEGRP